MAPKKTKRVLKTKKQKTVKRSKSSSKGKKAKKQNFNGSRRAKINGQPEIAQKTTVTKQLASSMLQSRTKAQGLAQSLARGMGQSLA